MNRSTVLALLAVIVLASGVAVHGLAADRRAERVVPRWEYNVVSLIEASLATDQSKGIVSGIESFASELEKRFNGLGNDGWELLSCGESIAVFKRAKQ